MEQTAQYTVISGTHRNDSNTLKIAQQYQQLLIDQGIRANLLSLEGLNVLERDRSFIAMEQEILVPTRKFIFISPEYNGSFPGVLKAMFDTSEIRTCWWGKKALLTGVSTGRAGNLRGMEHLTGILHYMKVVVHPNKLPISIVDKLMSEDGDLVDAATLAAIREQLSEFMEL